MCRVSSILDTEAHSFSQPVNLSMYPENAVWLEMKKMHESEDFWWLQPETTYNKHLSFLLNSSSCICLLCHLAATEHLVMSLIAVAQTDEQP